MKGKMSFTPSTEHNFLQKCCEQENIVNVLGVASRAQLEQILSTGVTTDTWTELFIPEIVDVPCQKPDIENIDSIYSSVEIISQRVVFTPAPTDLTLTNWEGTKLTGKKLVIEGLLKQKVVYTAEREEQSLHSAHFIKPFSVYVVIADDTIKSDSFKVEPFVEDVYVCRLSERSIFKNTTIFIKVKPLC